MGVGGGGEGGGGVVGGGDRGGGGGELFKDTRPKTNTAGGGRKAHCPTPKKTRTIHPTVLPDR